MSTTKATEQIRECKCSREGCCASGKCESGNLCCGSGCGCPDGKACKTAPRSEGGFTMLAGAAVVLAIAAGAAWYYMKKSK